ncbi:hypothetical protein GGR51DRAFT_513041 [Nemania sp. FL0031]|nr:hypothetical protein GGR51DRAFT_513041 [Nemania sp. FL0031]
MNFPEGVGINNGVCLPQHDFIEGIMMQEYQLFSVGEIRGATHHKNYPFPLELPHISGGWKREGYDMGQATLRGRYHGAALVYARDQALPVIGKSTPDGHASIGTFTTHGHYLHQLLCPHASSSEDSRVNTISIR